eukprot:scaffold2767_cov177-Amphora_coffeaeformis.AAC.10
MPINRHAFSPHSSPDSPNQHIKEELPLRYCRFTKNVNGSGKGITNPITHDQRSSDNPKGVLEILPSVSTGVAS